MGMQAYAMKIDLLTNATVVQKAIDFVEKNRDYVEQYGQIAQLSFMLPVNSWNPSQNNQESDNYI